MMTADEMRAFVDRRLAALHQLLTTNTTDGMSAEQVDAFDAAADDLGIEFLWHADEGSGDVCLRMIGVVNGLLARNDQTMMMQYDEDGKFIGLIVANQTRFGRSTEAPPSVP